MFQVSGNVRRVATYNSKAGVPHVQVDLVEELAGTVRCSWEKANGYMPKVGDRLDLRVIELQAWNWNGRATPSVKVLEPHQALDGSEASAVATA